VESKSRAYMQNGWLRSLFQNLLRILQQFQQYGPNNWEIKKGEQEILSYDRWGLEKAWVKSNGNTVIFDKTDLKTSKIRFAIERLS
jgi:hypothetical protein